MGMGLPSPLGGVWGAERAKSRMIWIICLFVVSASDYFGRQVSERGAMAHPGSSLNPPVIVFEHLVPLFAFKFFLPFCLYGIQTKHVR